MVSDSQKAVGVMADGLLGSRVLQMRPCDGTEAKGREQGDDDDVGHIHVRSCRLLKLYREKRKNTRAAIGSPTAGYERGRLGSIA